MLLIKNFIPNTNSSKAYQSRHEKYLIISHWMWIFSVEILLTRLPQINSINIKLYP